MTFLPREPLSYFQKRKLEKQFVEQVPKYHTYGEKKRGFETFSNVFSSILAVGFGVAVHSK
jgi:hypothetical protein